MFNRMYSAMCGFLLVMVVIGCGQEITTSTGNHAYANSLSLAAEKASNSTILDYAVAMQLSDNVDVNLTPEDMDGKTLSEIARLVKSRNAERFAEERTAMDTISMKFPGLAKNLRRGIIEQSKELLRGPDGPIDVSLENNEVPADNENADNQD